MLVYDITDEASFIKISQLMGEIKEVSFKKQSVVQLVQLYLFSCFLGLSL